ncbi:unnamed protein product [Trichobilharzia regenti]|nr:unnamed protein product [Trichobilharzia regenti]
MISLSNITIWGFDEISQINEHTNQFSIEQEEIWLQSNKNQPNSDVSIKEWMMKRDRKLCDVYKIKFSIKFNKNLELSANWLLFPSLNSLTAKNDFIHIKFIDLIIDVSLHLFINQNGPVGLEIDYIKITNLSDIELYTFQDSNYSTDRNFSWHNTTVNNFENSLKKFTFSWLLDEKALRDVLFHLLEAIVTNALKTNLAQLQSNFTMNNKSVDCKSIN